MALFCTLGMFIIDENRYPASSNRPNEYDIIGGAGLYALIGARIVAGEKRSKSVCAIIDKGSDFPHQVERELQAWNTGTIFREDKTRLTSRGANTYDEQGIRHFEYLTAKKRIEASDILANEYLLHSKCFHLICSVDRCKELVDKIAASTTGNPVFIYEPLPDDCVSENFDKLLQLLPQIDVFTPNLNEACLLVGEPELPETDTCLGRIASKFSRYLTKRKSGLVLRCGALGCYVAAEGTSRLYPAYHQDQSKVIDVTGGGNLFCGGFAVAYVLTENWQTAAICGNIVSGCIIERLGMPEMGLGNGGETWNGTSFKERWRIYGEKNPGLSLGDLPSGQ
jgi:sugar/nucleoside kinase (ribokinase family)